MNNENVQAMYNLIAMLWKQILNNSIMSLPNGQKAKCDHKLYDVRLCKSLALNGAGARDNNSSVRCRVRATTQECQLGPKQQ